jgi:hypothetical protein
MVFSRGVKQVSLREAEATQQVRLSSNEEKLLTKWRALDTSGFQTVQLSLEWKDLVSTQSKKKFDSGHTGQFSSTTGR